MSDEFQQMLINTFLDEAEDQLVKWEEVCMEMEVSYNQESINLLFRLAHNMKGSSRACGLLAFGDFIHQIEDLIVPLRDHKIEMNLDICHLLLDAQEVLFRWVGILREDTEATVPTEDIVKRLAVYLPRAEKQDSSSMAFGIFDEDDSASAQPSSENTTDQVLATLEQGKSPPPPETQAKESKTKSKKAETIRVSNQKLDALLRKVSEISIQNEIIWQCRESGTLDSKLADETMSLLYKGLKDIQEEAFGLRLQTIDTLFQRLRRTALDVARKTAKSIEVETVGEDVELDKTMMEKIGDPLIHVIRNAVDHGVETTDERSRLGKTLPARVSIRAIGHASGVRLEVSDDGRGMSRQKIAQKAIEKGIIRSDAGMSDQEVFLLIMAAGFSTAEEVTDISGRGVGMDVVRQTIEDLGGQLTIESKEGQGSTFSLDLPASISVTEALIIDVAGEHYAVPLVDVREVVDLQDGYSQRRVNGRSVFDNGSHMLFVEELAQKLHIQVPTTSKPDGLSHIAILAKSSREEQAFVVDAIVGQQPVVIRPVEGDIDQQKWFSGATILSDGKPGMILNLKALSEAA